MPINEVGGEKAVTSKVMRAVKRLQQKHLAYIYLLASDYSRLKANPPDNLISTRLCKVVYSPTLHFHSALRLLGCWPITTYVTLKLSLKQS